MEVQTLYGQTLKISNTHKELTDKHVMNAGINWPIQASAAEIYKRIVIASSIPDDMRLAEIHDAEWANGKWEMPKELEHVSPLYTPIETKHVKRFG